jgi:hypothetical protein
MRVRMTIEIPDSDVRTVVEELKKIEKLVEQFPEVKWTVMTDDHMMLDPEVKAAIERLAEHKKRDREVKVAIERPKNRDREVALTIERPKNRDREVALTIERPHKKRRSVAADKKKGPKGPKV